jgi:PKD repeat protein
LWYDLLFDTNPNIAWEKNEKRGNNMKKMVFIMASIVLFATIALAADPELKLSNAPDPVITGQNLTMTCQATGKWYQDQITKAEISILNEAGVKVVNREPMTINGKTATYTYSLGTDAKTGKWKFKCRFSDGKQTKTQKRTFNVITSSTPNNRSPVANPGGPYTGTAGQAVSFNGSGSSDPDGDTLIYSWNFGDNSTGTGATPIHTYADAGTFTVTLKVNDRKGCTNAKQTTATITAATGGHTSILSYNGPATCVACHPNEAQAMLSSVHVKWAGPTPELTNTNGEELGKAKGGINTFCTYAMSSKAACFGCHIRADGNAPDAPQVNDVDCLMCHNDVYQRKFIPDPNNSRTVTNILGQIKTYFFGKTDTEGNYLTEPDFTKMPVGTTMVSLAQTVHLPTRKSCLRCHAGAGGGDWTKRGDIGVNSANPTIDQDFHMSTAGADLSCADCHATGNHVIGGRGIDLRATDAPDPKCTDCHSAAPHADATVNRHATGQVSCQTCHIQTFGKGGATEMSRDWMKPYWNPGLCQGQGGFPGEEFMLSNVKPDYRWFDGTSYVYNIGETISPNADGTYTMAKANGAIFDGESKIVPIKDHWSIMGLSSDGKIVPPVIMEMFMTGYFDQALAAGMDEQGMPGNYQIVHTNAEMLITHGVDPKAKAPNCAACHASTGKSDLMIPFAELGYHKFNANVESCTACHKTKTATFTSMHDKHVRNKKLSCTQCHDAN